MRKIHHIGIACRTIEDITDIFDLTAEDASEIYYDYEQNNTLYFFYNTENSLWIEVVVPFNADSTVWNYLKRQRMGVHHLGFSSKDFVNDRAKLLPIKGVFELGGYSLLIHSFGGRIKTLFFSVKGFLIEYVLNVKD